MRANLDHLRWAVSALRFMSVAARESAERRRFARAEQQISAVLSQLAGQTDDESQVITVETPVRLSIFCRHRERILDALGELQLEWELLARRLEARKGKLPQLHQEERGNAAQQAKQLWEAREYLMSLLPTAVEQTTAAA